MKAPCALQAIVGVLVTVLMQARSPQTAQAQNGLGSANSPPVACSADSPVIAQNGSVQVRAWVAPLKDKTPEYLWTAVAGTITGVGREAKWDFSGVNSDAGQFEATVRVAFPTGTFGNCSVKVFVAEKERRTGKRDTSRSFLVKGQREAEGYGLYSYVLLGTRPITSNRQRYLKTIEAYLSAIEGVNELEDYVKRSELNIAYLPLQVAANSKPTADWILEHYDYARARALLDLLPGNLREGPYVISVSKPLSSGDPTTQHLFQDLSSVLPNDSDLAAWWIREFLNQAAQERFWEPKTAHLLVLKLRTTIAALASASPDVQKGLDTWISWIQ